YQEDQHDQEHAQDHPQGDARIERPAGRRWAVGAESAAAARANHHRVVVVVAAAGTDAHGDIRPGPDVAHTLILSAARRAGAGYNNATTSDHRPPGRRR